jgi:preprotein translocase subunit SecB
MEKHPIQIVYVNVGDIDFVAYMSGYGFQETNYDVKVGFTHSPYNSEEKSIHLRGRATIGKRLEKDDERTPEYPFYLDIHLLARFEVDEDNFDINFIGDWAKKNAPMLMMPYLREQVSSLAIRCGFPGVSLPLIKVPKYKDDRQIKKENESD